MPDRRTRGAAISPLTWLVTRAPTEGRAWVASLRALGLRAALLPCIARRRRAFPSGAFEVGAGRPVLFVTSAYAAGGLPRRRLAALGVRVVALEPRSAAALRARGFEVALAAPGGAVALAEALACAVAEGRAPFAVGERLDVVYPTSDVGGAEPEQRRARRTLARLGRLACPVLYETTAPTGLGAALRRRSGRRVGLVFASPSAVRHFVAALGPASARPRVEAVACLGASTARAWNASKPSAWPRARRAERSEGLFALCAELEAGPRARRASSRRALSLVPRRGKE